MKNRIIMPAILSLLFISSLTAADFWEEKPFPEWSQKECAKLLADSPWAHPYAMTGAVIPGMMRAPGRDAPSRSFGDDSLASQTGDREVHVFLQFRFLTAKPVKAAIGRMRMLSAPGNKDLEQQVNSYVEQDSGPEIVVEVTYYSEPSGHWALRRVEGFLNKSTLESIHNKVWLGGSSTNKRVTLSRYQGPSDNYPGALLYFPRNDEDGNPHFDGTGNNILLHMETDFGEVDLLMDPEKMRFDQDFTF